MVLKMAVGKILAVNGVFDHVAMMPFSCLMCYRLWILSLLIMGDMNVI